jgi:hypothetical protein
MTRFEPARDFVRINTDLVCDLNWPQHRPETQNR